MTTTAADEPVLDVDLDRSVAVHPLRYLDEGDEVTVGRADTDSYCVLPADGAALLHQLENGVSPRRAGDWYQQVYGETVDVVEFLAAMKELGFLSVAGEEIASPVRPLRWQRLGRAVFSPVAWIVYIVLLGTAVWAMVRHHDLLPHYRNLFFTPYMTVLELVLFVGQVPLLLLHESFHMLAGRRLGLRSRLRIGRRLYYLVLETSLDGLVAVPRRQRYLPMLAGMLMDLLVLAALTLLAAAVRHPDGTQPLVGGVCLALAFGTLLRFVWQFYFYLQTDLYHVIVTTLGCVDLQKTARQMIANRFNRRLGRPDRCFDESVWHPRDRVVARWYSWLIVIGYTVSIVVLVLVMVPTSVWVLSVVIGRLVGGPHTTPIGIADSTVFLILNLAQLAIVIGLAIRQRRRRRAKTYQHIID